MLALTSSINLNNTSFMGLFIITRDEHSENYQKTRLQF